MSRRMTVLICVVLSCAGLEAQRILFVDNFRDGLPDPPPDDLIVEGANVGEVFFDDATGNLVVTPEEVGVPFEVGFNFRSVEGFEEGVCYKIGFSVEAEGDGGGGGGVFGDETIEWSMLVYDKDDPAETTYRLLYSKWDNTASLNFETEKTPSTGGSNTVKLSLASVDSFSLLKTATPQWDRFSEKDEDDKEKEKIQFKMNAEGKEYVLYPKSDPPPTVTTDIKAVFNGLKSVTFDFVQLEGKHTTPVPAVNQTVLWLLIAVLVALGVVTLKTRRAPAPNR